MHTIRTLPTALSLLLVILLVGIGVRDAGIFKQGAAVGDGTELASCSQDAVVEGYQACPSGSSFECAPVTSTSGQVVTRVCLQGMCVGTNFREKLQVASTEFKAVNNELQNVQRQIKQGEDLLAAAEDKDTFTDAVGRVGKIVDVTTLATKSVALLTAPETLGLSLAVGVGAEAANQAAKLVIKKIAYEGAKTFIADSSTDAALGYFVSGAGRALTGTGASRVENLSIDDQITLVRQGVAVLKTQEAVYLNATRNILDYAKQNKANEFLSRLVAQ